MFAAIHTDEGGSDRIFMRKNGIVKGREKPIGFTVSDGKIQQFRHLAIIQVMQNAGREDNIKATAPFGQPVSGSGTVRLEKAV